MNELNNREDLGNIKQDKKKTSRKSKKQNEKEIINEYYLDNNENSLTVKRKIYENIQYLSPNERTKFEC